MDNIHIYTLINEKRVPVIVIPRRDAHVLCKCNGALSLFAREEKTLQPRSLHRRVVAFIRVVNVYTHRVLYTPTTRLLS